MSASSLSKREGRKLLVTLVFAAIYFGLAGILGMLFMQWLMRQNYAPDSTAKHGISTRPSSRLGGVAVVVITCTLMAFSDYLSPGAVLFKDAPVRYFSMFLVASCFSLGLWDDLSIGGLRPRFRLVTLSLVYAIVLAGLPALIPSSLGIAPVDYVMSIPLVGLVLTIIFCVGFLNAINMADGANGLVPGIALLSFFLFSLLNSSPVWSYLVIGFGMFLIFNLVSGRLFLGDAGSYSVACLLSLGGLFMVSEGEASPWLLAATLSYPCLEMVVSMGRRTLSGKSMFLPDNHHLHNRLHGFLRRYLKGAGLPNAVTGVAITMATSGVSVFLYYFGWLTALDERWLVVFLAQSVLYGLVYFQLGRLIKH
ncbi:glycosyltransferase [SAR92 clade bacterium H455]|uniref:Glycosyltransferase n=1 Tax=SAR92 clade bacterium H455 TaxID=2974818 RepID=A0ABY5TQK6_9GAMM|nr:glycosyltransferase [SAR92 clade bacterium H455]